jgi:hypothetical protein
MISNTRVGSSSNLYLDSVKAKGAMGRGGVEVLGARLNFGLSFKGVIGETSAGGVGRGGTPGPWKLLRRPRGTSLATSLQLEEERRRRGGKEGQKRGKVREEIEETVRHTAKMHAS